MKPYRLLVLSLLMATTMIASPSFARVHDHLFASPFDLPNPPISDADAQRFLTQATFGPVDVDVARLKIIGYSEWIEEQMGLAATVARPFVQVVVNTRTGGAQSVGQTQRINRWFWQAVYAPDQLRQRMAFALSQIFVVSDQSSAINQDIVPMTEYYDVLTRGAFNGYRDLLGTVTQHPTMAKYLSYFHNQKPSATTLPDENYAREVMQLFSVGLVMLNQDFTQPTPGTPIPTYDQSVITHTAKVFTGLTYNDAPTNPANFFGGGLTVAGTSGGMSCWGTELFALNSGNMRHDISGDDNVVNSTTHMGDAPKTVLAGMTIPPNQSCAQDLTDELDIIAAHDNVAPFIAHQLIQRFVTSNPSPAYVGRVAAVFNSNIVGERGDLGDVIKAVLLDTEARTPPVQASNDSYGKLREPLVGLIAMWRAFNALAPPADLYGEINMTGTTNTTSNTNFLSSMGQGPLQSPTVFNFYAPDFQQPGALFADQNLNSPEFQIVNEGTTYSSGNVYYLYTANSNQSLATPLPTNRPLINLAPLITLASAQNFDGMADLINSKMLYGSMSTYMHSQLSGMAQFMSSATPAERAWSMIYVTMLSPEYAAQR